jgi:hypothetical protein
MFIGIKNPGTDNEWFDVGASAEDIAELGESISAGEYRLVRKLKVTTQAKTEVIPMRTKAGE